MHAKKSFINPRLEVVSDASPWLSCACVVRPETTIFSVTDKHLWIHAVGHATTRNWRWI